MYRHTQIGKVTLPALALAGVACASAAAVAGAWLGAAALGGVFALLAVGFGWLTVEVDGQAVRLRFGPGVIRRAFPLASIREVRAVRNRWWYGWGVKLTPHGWLYNVSGLDAVEIRLDGGRACRIGTDEPRELEAAIRGAAGLDRRR